MKYALIIDNNVQWFTYLVGLTDKNEVVAEHYLDSGIGNKFLTNLFNRESSFTNLKLKLLSDTNTFCGVWISEYEYRRVVKMIELFPSVEQYLKLGKLENIE